MSYTGTKNVVSKERNYELRIDRICILGSWSSDNDVNVSKSWDIPKSFVQQENIYWWKNFWNIKTAIRGYIKIKI